jgi:electron transfer flavoprotein alpha subunit
MATLLVAEHDDKTLNGSTAKAMTAAKALGAEVHVLVAGQGCKPAADAAAKLDGVAKVLIADDARYAHRLAEPVAALIVALAKNYDAMSHPPLLRKELHAASGVPLDVMQISEVIKVESPDTFQRPIYAGNAIETVQSSDKKKVITMRTASFQRWARAAMHRSSPKRRRRPGYFQLRRRGTSKSTGRSSRRRAQQLPAARSAARRISRNTSSLSPIGSAPPRRSRAAVEPATRRMTGRWDDR